LIATKARLIMGQDTSRLSAKIGAEQAS
jgi:hypothetical protein